MSENRTRNQPFPGRPFLDFGGGLSDEQRGRRDVRNEFSSLTDAQDKIIQAAELWFMRAGRVNGPDLFRRAVILALSLRQSFSSKIGNSRLEPGDKSFPITQHEREDEGLAEMHEVVARVLQGDNIFVPIMHSDPKGNIESISISHTIIPGEYLEKLVYTQEYCKMAGLVQRPIYTLRAEGHERAQAYLQG